MGAAESISDERSEGGWRRTRSGRQGNVWTREESGDESSTHFRGIPVSLEVV